MAQEIADSTLLDTWGSSGAKVEPDISKIIEGWQLGEQPPHEYMNWLQNTFGSKLNHILKNGVASWNNTTQYLASSSVQHNGNVWLCKTTNTNSEPTDVNANWKRIITVESLTTVLAGYVALTDFTGTNQSKATDGYQKFPGGLIIQWGLGNTPGQGVTSTTTYPVSFTTRVVYLGSGIEGLTATPSALPFVFTFSNRNLSSFQVKTGYTGSNLSFFWLAIGY